MAHEHIYMYNFTIIFRIASNTIITFQYHRAFLIANTRSMFALLYQFWSYILRQIKCVVTIMVAAILENRKFESYRETSHEPSALIEFFTSPQTYFCNHSIKEMYIKYFSLQ